MLGVSKPLPNPTCIEAHRTDIKAYIQQAHSIVELICSHLDNQLHLAKGTLVSLQPLDKPSGTQLRMIRCLPQVSVTYMAINFKYLYPPVSGAK